MTYCIPTPIPHNLPVIQYTNYNSPYIILDGCLKFFGISKKMLKNKSREREVLWPRQMTTHILCYHSCLTTVGIGKILNQDHSSVCNSRTAVDKRLVENEDFKAQYDSLIKYLGL